MNDRGEAPVHSCSLPEGAIVEGVVEVVSYIRPDGGMGYATRWATGNAPVSTLIGLLHMAIHDALASRGPDGGFS